MNSITTKFALAAVFATIAATTGIIVEAQSGSASSNLESGKKEPVLMKKESIDVDNDGKLDTVSYFDSNGDGTVDAEAIDLGSTGTVTVLAIRCDADGDGREDDWAVVNASTEEITAALIDANDDGEADAVAYGDGKREELPVATGVIRSKFQY